MQKQIARFTVNGKPYEVTIEPHITLLEVLRDQLDLTGTKHGCGIGQCGACTVLIDGKPILSCLTLATAVKDRNILTIEGLAEGNILYPIQKTFVDHGAIQCGFCTPGMILCRCTGYVKIIDAVLAAAEAMREGDIK